MSPALAGHVRHPSRHRPKPVRQLTEDDIWAGITSLGNLHHVIHDAKPSVKAAICEQLGLKVTYLPGQDKSRTDVTISPETFAPKSEQYGKPVRGCQRAEDVRRVGLQVLR